MKIIITNTTSKKIEKKFYQYIKKAVTKTLLYSKKKFEGVNPVRDNPDERRDVGCLWQPISNGVNIIFVNDRKIKEINRKFLHKNKPTDVVVFNYDLNIPFKYGDIYISIDTALRNSKVYRMDFKTEILILVIHGTLHLAGYDDSTFKKRKKMNEKTLEVIKKLI